MRKLCLENGLSPSIIRSLYEYGKKRKAEVGEENVFDFSIGNASSPTPDCVNEKLIELLKDAATNRVHLYTSNAGDTQVRKAIADYLNKTYGADTDGSLIFMSCGAAASLSVTINALINPGDEVIIFAPHFPDYRVFSEFAGATVKVVKPDYQTFQPDFADFLDKLSPKTRLVIIDSPNNPSGVMYTKETIERLASILSEKETAYDHPIYLLSDEPYRELIYDGQPYPFPLNFYDDSIVAYSFSKSWSLPGERIGYIVANKKCLDANNVFAAINGSARSLGYVCAPSLFQKMIPSCLGVTADLSLYKRNRDLLYRSLTELGYEAIYPQGAFYMLLKCLEEDSLVFSEKAKSLDLLLVPTDAFGLKGYVRISYCVDTDVIERSLPAFKRLKEMYGR